MREKQGQVAFEFMVFVGVAILIMIIFAIVAHLRVTDLRSDQERILLEDTATVLQRELLIASSVQDDYLRTFTIPADLQGTAYSIVVDNGTITASSPLFSYSAIAPNITGQVIKGQNIVKKKEGIVCLNVPTCPYIT